MTTKKILWSVMDISNHIENNMFQCLMFGEDDEGNEYTGLADVIDPENAPEWDEVTEIEKETTGVFQPGIKQYKENI